MEKRTADDLHIMREMPIRAEPKTSKLLLFFRTALASFLCIGLFMISGKLFNILPAILYVIIVAIYYQQAMLWYFSLSSYGVVSSILGIIFSLLFLCLYIVDFSMAETVFTKLLFVFGGLGGLAQTIKSIGIRLEKGFSNS